MQPVTLQPVTPQPEATVQPVATGRPVRQEVAERLRILIVAGIPVGVLVAGLGGRLAMGLLRVTSPDSVRGVTSDDGFRIGELTIGGTYSLLTLGAAVGIIGAAAYRLVAVSLIGPRLLRRFTTAAASGAVVGSLLLHADGVDFSLLKPTWLAIGLFIALPALFGWVIGPAVDRVVQRDVRPVTVEGRAWRRWIAPIVLVACFPPTLILVAVSAVLVTLSVTTRDTWPRVFKLAPMAQFVLRGAWLSIAVLGVMALVTDVRAITS